jgi:hypothetical protein
VRSAVGGSLSKRNAKAQNQDNRVPHMNFSQRLLHFGCAVAMVCLLAGREAAGQNLGVITNRVTQTPGNEVRMILKGNVHPLAKAEYSRGAVADSLPMARFAAAEAERRARSGAAGNHGGPARQMIAKLPQVADRSMACPIRIFKL